MKNLIYLMILLFPLYAYSERVKKCDLYHVVGYVKKDAKSILKLVINEKSKSEIQLFISTSNISKFSAYLDTFISAEVSVNQFDGFTGVASDPINIKLSVPDPLLIKNDDSFKLVSKKGCAK